MKYKKWLTILCMVFSFAAAAGCGKPEMAKDSSVTKEKSSSDTTEAAEGEENSSSVTEEKNALDVTEKKDALDDTEKASEEMEDEKTTENIGEEPKAEGEFSFAEVSNREFWFGSGAGAWCTVLYIHEDGTFEGTYHDSDMGDIGEENPNGVMYLSNFTGKFTNPEKVNDDTYSFRIEEVKLEQEPKTEEVIEGVRYIYSEPYGLDEAENLFIYLPGAPIEELPEGFMTWVGTALGDGVKELPFYGLYNEAPGYGFSSSELTVTYETVKRELEDVEEAAKSLETKIQAGKLTQIEMNEATAEIYRLWDDELNRIWGYLKLKLDEESMEQITADEREWISYKESEISKAGADYEGGSMQAMIENDKGAELTKARVYELAEYLK